MAKQFNEKQKLLFILKILTEETDADHRLSTTELIGKLKQYDINAERKSIYRDLDTLADFGYEIDRDHTGCCLYNRDFELPELKLLVDAVQASKFITEKKSNDIISKLVSMASRHDREKLKRGVFVAERVKSSEKTALYVIDGLHTAINSNKMVSFKYLEWTPDKKKRPRHGGKVYTLSPWGLIWDDENYYLLAYDDDFGSIKHYRVDKITDVTVLDESRQGYDQYSRLDLGKYSKRVFGMFNGDDDIVTLEFPEHLCGVIFDRFGTDMTVFSNKNGTYSVSIPVKVSDNFLSWIIQFGGEIKITAPDAVSQRMKNLLLKTLENIK